MARIERGTGKIVESAADTTVTAASTAFEKPRTLKVDDFIKFATSNADELTELTNLGLTQGNNDVKISDLLAKHLGFDASPRKNTFRRT